MLWSARGYYYIQDLFFIYYYFSSKEATMFEFNVRVHSSIIAAVNSYEIAHKNSGGHMNCTFLFSKKATFEPLWFPRRWIYRKDLSVVDL